MSEIIAVDIGTSRIKTARFDENGKMTALHSHRLNRAASPETQNAEQWFEVTAELLRKMNEENSFPADAVVLTGNMHALLGIDAHGDPVAPAVLWSDNSAREEADELNRRAGDFLLHVIGNRAAPVFTLPKIMRMKNLHPGLYRKTVTFMQSKDYVSFRLTGSRVTDPTDASGVLSMELSSSKWASGLLDDFELDREKFPEIRPSASVCGQVTAEAAVLTGLRQGTPVVTGAGDLSSAALGSGVNARMMSLTLGTAGQLLAVGELDSGCKLAGKLFRFAHADPEQELFLGSVPSGGFSFEWLAKIHNLSMEQFFQLADSVPLSENLPLFYPYLLGKGAPSMDYTPCGSWQGLNADHTLNELCRAAVFGTLCPLRICADLLESCVGTRPQLVLQALACREKAVRETACALFQQTKYLPANSEASLLGAAVIGWTAIGAFPTLSDAAERLVRNQKIDLPQTDCAQALFRRFMQ